MYCNKCGEKTSDSWKYCPNCRNVLNSENKETNEQNTKSKEAIVYIVLFFIGLIGIYAFRYAKGAFFLISLISIVTGYIRCPDNKIIKIIFWLFLIWTAIIIIFSIIFIYVCLTTFASCPE